MIKGLFTEALQTLLCWTILIGGDSSLTWTLTNDDDEETQATKIVSVNVSDCYQSNIHEQNFYGVEKSVQAKPEEFTYKVLQYINMDKPYGIPITVIRREKILSNESLSDYNNNNFNYYGEVGMNHYQEQNGFETFGFNYDGSAHLSHLVVFVYSKYVYFTT